MNYIHYHFSLQLLSQIKLLPEAKEKVQLLMLPNIHLGAKKRGEENTAKIWKNIICLSHKYYTLPLLL